jgi:hypothetical protein
MARRHRRYAGRVWSPEFRIAVAERDPLRRAASLICAEFDSLCQRLLGREIDRVVWRVLISSRQLACLWNR